MSQSNISLHTNDDFFFISIIKNDFFLDDPYEIRVVNKDIDWSKITCKPEIS